MPTFRGGITFTHPAGLTGFARVVWFYLSGKASILAEKWVRVPFDWTDEQISEESIEWASVHGDDYPNAERLVGGWENVFLWNVSVRAKDKPPTIPALYFAVLAPDREQARKRAITRYRYALEVFGPQDFISVVHRAD